MKESNEPRQERHHETSEETMIEAEDLQAHIDELKSQQNLRKGIIGALGGAILGALIWAIVTIVTNYQMSYMAIGVAFLVGMGMRTMGKGVDPIFGYVGAGLSFFGCLLGDFFYLIHYVARSNSVSYIKALTAGHKVIFSALWHNTDAKTLLFYAVAVYVGYRFSFWDGTEDEEDE